MLKIKQSSKTLKVKFFYAGNKFSDGSGSGMLICIRINFIMLDSDLDPY